MPNEFFKPHQRTIIYVHGWQPGTSARQFRESFNTSYNSRRTPCVLPFSMFVPAPRANRPLSSFVATDHGPVRSHAAMRIALECLRGGGK